MLRIICITFAIIYHLEALKLDECNIDNNDYENTKYTTLKKFAKACIPALDNNKHKGDAGKIGIIGGSIEYTGAPYFSAMSSLKMGADLVYVITTETAAPVIKTYSPDLIVYPFLHLKYTQKIKSLLTKMDVVIIGPGLGKENDTIELTLDIMESCKQLRIPMVVDADGLYAIFKNPSIIKDYPKPGVVLTPNFIEMERLMVHIGNISNEVNYWGTSVSILVKGKEDKFISSYSKYNWNFSLGGSGRRVGGQGDILSGILATFFNWTLKCKICENDNSENYAASVASFVASKITRICNENTFKVLGRSMLASDMLQNINFALENLF